MAYVGLCPFGSVWVAASGWCTGSFLAVAIMSDSVWEAVMASVSVFESVQVCQGWCSVTGMIKLLVVIGNLHPCSKWQVFGLSLLVDIGRPC